MTEPTFTLKEVQELLDLRVDPSSTCADVRRRAQEKVAAIEQRIASLERMRTVLRRLSGGRPGRQVLLRERSGDVRRPRAPRHRLALEQLATPGGQLFLPRRQSMSSKRTIEIFSAGCPACQDTIRLVNDAACPSCEVSVLAMSDAAVGDRARELGIRRVPAVVIDGVLASCCAGDGPDEATLRAAGLGRAAV